MMHQNNEKTKKIEMLLQRLKNIPKHQTRLDLSCKHLSDLEVDGVKIVLSGIPKHVGLYSHSSCW